MPISHLSDFSDRVSPMLVKELRQGMRAKAFIALFLSLQIFLAVILLSAAAASTSDHVGSTISGIMFTFFAIAVLVVQPLRGTGALSSEVKGNTIDMMVLTRLSAWRIVFGKWVAIVSQSALLLSTIIPYLILRYFFGGMNLVSEIVLLLLMFLTSMALTAVTVGLSGCASVIIRSLLPMFGIPILLIMMLQGMFFMSMRGSSDIMDAFNLATPESRIGVAAYTFAIAYLGASMLSLGASLIAPAAENHALPRRIVAFFLLLLAGAIGCHPEVEGWFVAMMVSIIGIPALITALTDSAPYVSTITDRFARFGPIGRALGWFLHPTWPSGILAGVLMGAVGLATIAIHLFGGNHSYGMDDEEATILLAIFGGLIFPAAWQVFLFKGEGQRLAHYLLLAVGSFVLSMVLTGLASSMNNGWFLWFFAWHPLAFLAMVEENTVSDDAMFASVLIVDLVLIAILVARALMDIRKYGVHAIDADP
jgi:ABC-type transport system involved in multi-copper enzyme maturation permease subunit